MLHLGDHYLIKLNSQSLSIALFHFFPSAWSQCSPIHLVVFEIEFNELWIQKYNVRQVMSICGEMSKSGTKNW